jgi:hypothetical protein
MFSTFSDKGSKNLSKHLIRLCLKHHRIADIVILYDKSSFVETFYN